MKRTSKSKVVLYHIYKLRSALIHVHQITHGGASFGIDPCKKFYAQLNLSLNKISCLSSPLLPFSQRHIFFYLISASFSIPPVTVFLSFLGCGVSLQSLPYHECAQLPHPMDLLLQLLHTFPTFDRYDHLLPCSISQKAGCC